MVTQGHLWYAMAHLNYVIIENTNFFVIHIYLVTYYLLYLNKLNKEASLITDPPGTSSTALSEKIKN